MLDCFVASLLAMTRPPYGRHPISPQPARHASVGLARSCQSSALCPEEGSMITFTRRSLALLPAAAPLLSAEFARALELNPAAVAYRTSDQIKWSPPSPNGAQNAVLA